MVRAETKLTRPQTKIRMEPRFPWATGFHQHPGRQVTTSSRFPHRPGGDFSSNSRHSRAGAAVTKLRNVSFQESEDWWGLLAAVSKECGFSLTRIEESERYRVEISSESANLGLCLRSGCCDEGKSLVQTLVQGGTNPVLGKINLQMFISTNNLPSLQ